MKNHTVKQLTNNSFYWIIISIVILIGIIIRIKGLGTWPLALDEYYLIKSSEFIIEHGLPQFPNGGYYSRGILLQYLIAPLLSLGVKAELAGRVYTVFANLITIPAVYLISKKIGNQLIATVVVVIFSLSVWEIEFARFARMYTPFQAIFMWYIYFAMNNYITKEYKYYKWMLILSAISIFVYEGSIFLAVFNFIPFVINKRINYRYFIFACLLLGASVFANIFDFRTLFSNPIFPDELEETIRHAIRKTPIVIPKILLPYAFSSFLSVTFILLLTFVNIFVFVKVFRLIRLQGFWSIFSIIVLFILAFLNQFGLFLLIFIISYFWKLTDFTINKRKLYLLLSFLMTSNLFFWFAFGLFSNSWYSLFTDFSSYSTWGISKRLLIGFFNFPNNYYAIINYFNTLPLLTVFSSFVFLLYIVMSLLSSRNNKYMDFIIGTVVFFSLLATIPTLIYEETRYTFFIVPLLIIGVNYSLFSFSEIVIKNKKFVSSFLYVFIILSVFVLSNDFNLYHLLNVDSQEINYRLPYNSSVKKHLYRRWDIKTPINYVSANMKSDDLIIINENSQEYYLQKVDYFSFDYQHHAFKTLSVEKGTKERWSNSNLLYDNITLINFIENRTQTIWFLVFPENYLNEIEFYNRYNDYLVYAGLDDLVKVYKFPEMK